MRLIDAIGLKQALAVSVILEDKKTIGQIIDEQPTIEPERKTGRWIHKELNHFCCDQCKTLFVVLIGTEELHFCPNCGADMRGEEHG